MTLPRRRAASRRRSMLSRIASRPSPSASSTTRRRAMGVHRPGADGRASRSEQSGRTCAGGRRPGRTPRVQAAEAYPDDDHRSGCSPLPVRVEPRGVRGRLRGLRRERRTRMSRMRLHYRPRHLPWTLRRTPNAPASEKDHRQGGHPEAVLDGRRLGLDRREQKGGPASSRRRGAASRLDARAGLAIGVRGGRQAVHRPRPGRAAAQQRPSLLARPERRRVACRSCVLSRCP